MPSATTDPIREFLLSQVELGRLPGACWTVEARSHVVSAGALGHASLTPVRKPTTEDTPYDLASLTKPLATALIGLLLEQEGRWDLDAPASEILDELEGSPYQSVSLLDLGSHRAGLPAWRPLYLEAEDLQGYLKAISRLPRAVAPGTTLYSDLGYVLLGAAVERASGEKLDRLFAGRVAGPLGLTDIGFPSGARFRDAAATEVGNGYERAMVGAAGDRFSWREEGIQGEVHDGNAHALGGVAGHAGLFGTAAGVADLGRELLSGTVLPWSPRMRTLMLRPVAGRGSRSFGFVMAADSEAAREVLPHDAPGHTGFTGTSLWLDPEREQLFVLLTNRVHPVVLPHDFQPVRREFHRIAAALCGA